MVSGWGWRTGRYDVSQMGRLESKPTACCQARVLAMGPEGLELHDALLDTQHYSSNMTGIWEMVW